jgi:hypothetical protein
MDISQCERVLAKHEKAEPTICKGDLFMTNAKSEALAAYFKTLPEGVSLRVHDNVLNDEVLIEISREDFERYIENQGSGTCYICGKGPEAFWEKGITHHIEYKERGMDQKVSVHAECLRKRIEEYPMDQQAKGFARKIGKQF